MKHIDIIALIYLGMAALAIGFGIWGIIAGAEAFEFDEDPVPPAQYEDYEVGFYNPEM
jgi:hypothetical protein